MVLLSKLLNGEKVKQDEIEDALGYMEQFKESELKAEQKQSNFKRSYWER